MAIPGVSLLAMLQGSSSEAAPTVTPSPPAQVQAVQREGFLAQWAPVIVTNKSPEEIVSMDYIHEKLLESDHGGKVIV